jgi:CubicO group peptidase (beta-lactamase class C family)
LRTLNGGKESPITWRHLANQLSGYGLKENPGAAFAYNDFAIALYYDTLLHKVYHTDANQVFAEHIAGPLHFQDLHELTPPGKFYVEGMLLISPMDLARFGVWMLNEGRWHDKQLIRPDLARLLLHTPVPVDLPMSSGQELPMLPEQRSFGSDTRSDTVAGPGIYSFNWWLNKRDQQGRQLCPELPEDAFFALGACGNMLCVIPSLDIVAVWMRSRADDCLEAFTRPDTLFRQATRQLRAAVVDVRL